jgi:hypothetical protein
MNPIITLKEMRRRVAEKLFAWIEDLTDNEYELLREHGPKLKDVHRFDGSITPLNHIRRVPERLRSRIDRVIGRWVRMDAQYATIDTWLQDHGFIDATFQPADRSRFNKGLREEQELPDEIPTAAPHKRRGPKPTVRHRVMHEMRKAVQSGEYSLEQLVEMKEEALAAKFVASRETCRKAIEELSKELMKSNSDK